MDRKFAFNWIMALFVGVGFGGNQSFAQFTISAPNETVTIVYDADSGPLDSIAAHLLARDIKAVSGQRPKVQKNLHNVAGNAIIIGEKTSGLINNYVDATQLSGKWDSYAYTFKSRPVKGINKAMFIVGSNPRGTAYGVFDLSEKIGVSPWYWWADAPVKKEEEIKISMKDTLSKEPSVKYRGMFINDEDWGLQPWAARTFDASGGIGPKTYDKLFELLLRLKGNMIWPAMHPNTKAFFLYPGNPEMAKKWDVVVGTSHAEPMLRNNVGEWDRDIMGPFNYQSNRSTVYGYWEKRVRQSKGIDAFYTVGMRGYHDTGMEGPQTMEDKVRLLEKVFSDQRGLLKKYINKDVAQVPQAFTPYKEVLEIYDNGLDVPEDVTIIWPDDNFGNIRRFSDKAEQELPRGSGVYYHLSYYPYLWLNPEPPLRIWREMTRASEKKMNRIWVVNVGDIKRREWETELFMDMAWDVDSWTVDNIEGLFDTFASRDISKKHGEEIADLIWEYHQLSIERRPEFMGFSKPNWAGRKPIQDPLYSLWDYGDEVQARMDKYIDLRKRAKKLGEKLPKAASDAYFELVYYPIAGAAAMNEKWLYAYKSREYAKQGRAIANQMSDSAFAAYDKIRALTKYANEQVANGKWEHDVNDHPGSKGGRLCLF